MTAPEEAGARIRETAKWLTVSLAGLGAVLVTGSQLSDLGSLEPWGTRFWAAVVGAGVAAVGSAAILAITIWVATSPNLGMSGILDMGQKHAALKTLWTDTRALAGHADMVALDAAHRDARQKRDDALAHVNEEPASQARYELLNTDFTYLDQVVSGVRKTATYRLLAWRWRRAGA